MSCATPARYRRMCARTTCAEQLSPQLPKPIATICCASSSSHACHYPHSVSVEWWYNRRHENALRRANVQGCDQRESSASIAEVYHLQAVLRYVRKAVFL